MNVPGRDDAAEWLQRIAPVLCPILFALYPLLALFAHNETEVELGVLWLPIAICVVTGAALYAIFLSIFRRSAKAGVLASLVVGAFFYYGIFASRISAGGWFLVLWLALFALAAVAVARTARPLRDLTLILAAAAVVLAVWPPVRIARFQWDHPSIDASDPTFWPTKLRPPTLNADPRLPDIYVLIPDDFARTDVLKRYFHYDNGRFVKQLEKRGFVIADGVRSPYSDSEMNVAAEVNMDYLSRLPAILGKGSQDVRPVRRLIQDNRAARLLETLGYRYVHLDTDEVTFAAGNPDISPVATPDSFATLWMQHTILRRFSGTLGFDDNAANDRFRKAIRQQFDRLETVPSEPGPKFVVFHTLLPHDPYIFGPRGERVTFANASGEEQSSRLGMKYYVKQLRYSATKLLETIDAIRARSQRPPIIVVMSNEGFEGREEVLGEATMRDVRVKGFAAFLLPGAGEARPPAKLNTVNALRFVFNRFFGTHYPLLPNASYPELDAPYQYEPMPVR